MCTVLCSLLLGAGFDAYVVAGYAPLAVTMSDQTSAVCPLLEPHIPKAKPQRMQPAGSQRNPVQPKEAKYQIKSNAKLESAFLQVQSFHAFAVIRPASCGNHNVNPSAHLFRFAPAVLCKHLQAGHRQWLLLHQGNMLGWREASWPCPQAKLNGREASCPQAKLKCPDIVCVIGCYELILACQCVLLHVQKQQQAKEAEALLATAPAAPPAAAEMSASSPAAADHEKNNLVHAWVMVLSGKREVSTIHSTCIY